MMATNSTNVGVGVGVGVGIGKSDDKDSDRDKDRDRDSELLYFESLPSGYRFCPTDEELVVYYLKNKIFNRPMPKSMIIDLNIYAYSPQQLSEMYKLCRAKELYFFTPRDKKYPKGKRPNRAANDGFWKATGADKIIRSHGQEMGLKKSLVFYKGIPKSAVKTNWLMHEYRIDHNIPPSTGRDVGDMKLDDCVLCKIYERGKNTMKNIEQDDKGKAIVIHDQGVLQVNPQEQQLDQQQLDEEWSNDDYLNILDFVDDNIPDLKFLNH